MLLRGEHVQFADVFHVITYAFEVLCDKKQCAATVVADGFSIITQAVH